MLSWKTEHEIWDRAVALASLPKNIITSPRFVWSFISHHSNALLAFYICAASRPLQEHLTGFLFDSLRDWSLNVVIAQNQNPVSKKCCCYALIIYGLRYHVTNHFHDESKLVAESHWAFRVSPFMLSTHVSSELVCVLVSKRRRLSVDFIFLRK